LSSRVADKWIIYTRRCTTITPLLIAGFDRSTHFFQATRNGRRQRAKTLASSTLLTSLTLICPPTLLFTTSTSPSFSPPLLQREQGGLGGLGFHETPLAGLGRKGGGARVGSLVVLGFSKAAMRSHSKPGLG
jgi:hypothetical protein